MLRIGGFARLVGVSVRMLRHYDRLGLVALKDLGRPQPSDAPVRRSTK